MADGMTCEFGHQVTVELLDGVVEKHMHRDSVEVNTDTGEETVTYCPSCVAAAMVLAARQGWADVPAAGVPQA